MAKGETLEVKMRTCEIEKGAFANDEEGKAFA
jgi:hypothetical protein